MVPARARRGSAAEEERQRTLKPVYRRIDSVAGEVEAPSNYYYATWGEQDEGAPLGERKRVVILGSGPNRIGQGVEFDYCCVHAVQTYRELGYEAVMVNCNPETVSTDYDTSNRLYFEPLDTESVLAICEREKPVGVVIQFGGQTPLKLARAIEAAGFSILGTPFDAVDLAEDRQRFTCPLSLPTQGDRGALETHPLRPPPEPARPRRCCSARSTPRCRPSSCIALPIGWLIGGPAGGGRGLRDRAAWSSRATSSATASSICRSRPATPGCATSRSATWPTTSTASRGNFGITSSIWDRVFGTIYGQPQEVTTEPDRAQSRLRREPSASATPGSPSCPPTTRYAGARRRGASRQAAPDRGSASA